VTLYEFLEKGSLLMIPIGLCSLVAITVFLERLVGLAQKRVNPEEFSRTLLKLVNEGQMEQAENLCLQSSASVAQVAFVALKHRGRERRVIKDATDERGALEVARLERGVGMVGTMATITPLLGLLGTVTGMIQVFQKIEGVQDPQIDLLAGGIWEALISTGAGLTVAIPCYLAYRYLLGRVDTSSHQMEETVIDVIDALDRTADNKSESA
jgi:biopolymer transport protein ExbB